MVSTRQTVHRLVLRDLMALHMVHVARLRFLSCAMLTGKSQPHCAHLRDSGASQGCASPVVLPSMLVSVACVYACRRLQF